MAKLRTDNFSPGGSRQRRDHAIRQCKLQSPVSPGFSVSLPAVK